MTDRQKAEIIRLRNSGRSYSEIANATGVPIGTVRSTVQRAPAKKKCECCGETLAGRQGRFCSDACRYKWWRSHRDCGERVCPMCGKAFRAADLRRTFCSRACYHRSRRGEDGEEE